MVASLDAPDYPVRFDVDYPERLNRLTTLLRLIWAIPVLVLIYVAGNVTVFAPLLARATFRVTPAAAYTRLGG